MSDHRPLNCRFRLQDEGKPYPRSSCKACGRTITTGLGTSCQKLTSRPADAAKIIQKRIDTIIAEEGSQEPDTGVVNLPEWAQTAVEELEGILAALEPATTDAARAREVEVYYKLRWIAGARPPVHPEPMNGSQTFSTEEKARAFFRSLASDAKFVSLERIEVTSTALIDKGAA